MDQTVEITDEGSARAWLQTQDHTTRVWFATRCALRALPSLGADTSLKNSSVALACCRALLVAAAEENWPEEADRSRELLAASAAEAAYPEKRFQIDVFSQLSCYDLFARSASVAARCAWRTYEQSHDKGAAHAAHCAALSLEPVGSSSAAWVAASGDANAQMSLAPLWPDNNMPSVLADDWKVLKKHWTVDDADWSFWINWYERILIGEPLPWDLTQRIALEVTKAEWDAGQTVVAGRITEIIQSYKTNIGPRLVLNSDGLWDVEDDVTVQEEPVGFAISQVEINLVAALSAGNGLSETSGETILIRNACTIYRDQPSVVATCFWNACMALQRNIGDVYPDDAALIGLQNVLYTSVEELCAQDTLIRDRIAKLAALETRRMPTQSEKEDLKAVPEVMKKDLTEDAFRQLSDAVETVVNEDKPPKVWRARLVNWLTTLGQGIDKGQKHEKRATWLLKLGRKITGWFFEMDEQ
ncbi:hypothetical protein [Roseobacter litoralis]|uniref:hypothetical protein n=1 Tax=Roseobacter litoralis TaxID=42443 RepID=UPI002491E446|nr:hypothetical protein [Roseobacter litoralis]